MHAANSTFAEVAIGSEHWIRRSAVEYSRKIQFKTMCLYTGMHNFPQIKRPLTLHVKPMGLLMRLDILKVTGIWIE